MEEKNIQGEASGSAPDLQACGWPYHVLTGSMAALAGLLLLEQLTGAGLAGTIFQTLGHLLAVLVIGSAVWCEIHKESDRDSET